MLHRPVRPRLHVEPCPIYDLGVCAAGRAPEWGDVFELPVTDITGDLQVQLLHRNEKFEDSLIGHVQQPSGASVLGLCFCLTMFWLYLLLGGHPLSLNPGRAHWTIRRVNV